MHLTAFEVLVLCSTVLELNPLFQAIKCVRMKSAKDISLLTFGTIIAIGVVWLIYGFMLHSIPLIVGNSFKLVSALAVIIVYTKYKDS